MLTCPTCAVGFQADELFCPRDGSPLAAVAAPRSSSLTGRTLGGRYRLLEPLGQGGMGTVYRALHTLMDKQVAVKVLLPDIGLQPDAVARFHREARSASRLDHQNCIRVSDFGESEDGLLYLVMELLDGENLRQALRSGPLPAAEVARIGGAVATALEHAHHAGLVHRDLKPDNIFLYKGAVKVFDFGLAKPLYETGRDASITRAGALFGTPEYMAPEQALGEPVDGRTDVYGLGVTLYELLTGEVPFPRRSAQGLMPLLSRQVNEPPEPPRLRRPELDIPEALEVIILRCLAKRPPDRYPSAQAVADALQAAFPREARAIAAPARLRESRWGRVFATTLVLLVACMVTGRLLWVRRPVLAPPVRPFPVAPVATASSAAVEDQLARAALAERQGNRLRALYHLRRATLLAPDRRDPRTRLAALLERMGQKDDASRVARASPALTRKTAP